ncbi:MAG: NUDIX hydrolase [Desulfomonilia bacterium]
MPQAQDRHPYPESPQAAVGAVVFSQGRVLLVKRGSEPNKGRWALPGGRIHLGETLQEAAQREVLEETGIVVKARDPVYSFDFIEHDQAGRVQYHYIIVDLMADYVGGQPSASDDASDAGFFRPDEVLTRDVSRSTIELLKTLKFL